MPETKMLDTVEQIAVEIKERFGWKLQINWQDAGNEVDFWYWLLTKDDARLFEMFTLHRSELDAARAALAFLERLERK